MVKRPPLAKPAPAKPAPAKQPLAKQPPATSPKRVTHKDPTLRLSVTEWDDWLSAHHDSATGVLLLIAKKQSAEPPLTYAQALEIALTWGWIDGQKFKHDEHAWLQRFTPRRAKSPWSKINRHKAEQLLRAGRMHPPGQAQIERAKQDGRWQAAYDSARTAVVGDDFADALRANPTAETFFGQLDAANRYAILYRLQTAKKATTRSERIAKFVAMLARGETIYPKR